MVEVLTMGINVHEAKSIKIVCRVQNSAMCLPKFEAFCTLPHENVGTSQAFCTSNDAICRQPQALSMF